MTRPMQTAIPLYEILPIKNPGEYKLHFARRNKKNVEPLDDFVGGWENWRRWNSSNTSKRDDFNRRHIFSLARFYPRQDKQIWLFGGIFHVRERFPDKEQWGYRIEESDWFAPYIGRLLIECESAPPRPRSVLFEKHYEHMTVAQILESDYDWARNRLET